MRPQLRASLLASAALLSACSVIEPLHKADIAPVPKAPLESTTWQLIALDGELQPEYNIPTLILNPAEQRAVGYGGCNRFFAGYTVKGQQLTLSAPGSTMMACDPAAMKVEQRYLKDLPQITRYRIDGDTLDLFVGDDMRLRFRAKPAE